MCLCVNMIWRRGLTNPTHRRGLPQPLYRMPWICYLTFKTLHFPFNKRGMDGALKRLGLDNIIKRLKIEKMWKRTESFKCAQKERKRNKYWENEQKWKQIMKTERQLVNYLGNQKENFLGYKNKDRAISRQNRKRWRTKVDLHRGVIRQRSWVRFLFRDM